MGTSLEMEFGKVIGELRSFVTSLKKRRDIDVVEAKVGRRAAKKKIERARAIDSQAAAFFVHANGVRIVWEFQERGLAGGELEIAPIDAFLEAGEFLVTGLDGVRVGLLAAALRAGMGHGFVHGWEHSYQEGTSFSDPDVASFVRGGRVDVGCRVHFLYFSEHGRGVVLEAIRIPSQEAGHYGTGFLKVRFDEGTVGWLPKKNLKNVKVFDSYERMRLCFFDFEVAITSDVDSLLDDLARAVGPVDCWCSSSLGYWPTNGRRAAGLLSGRSFAQAATVVMDLEDAVAGKVEQEQRDLARLGSEFSRTEFARHRWGYTLDGVFTGLYWGLRILAHHRSASEEAPACELLPSEALERMRRTNWGSDLAEVLSGGVLEPPLYLNNDGYTGLPGDVSFYGITGA